MTSVGGDNTSDPRHQDGCATWHHGLVAGIVASYVDCVYIEIGILFAACWNVAAPLAAEAHGVDPDERCGDLMNVGHGDFWHMESDLFFREYHSTAPDVVFIDGDHSAAVVSRDVANAFEILDRYGTVIMHDTQPVIWPKDAPRPDLAGPREDLSGTGWTVREKMEKDPTLQVITFQRFPGITLARKC